MYNSDIFSFNPNFKGHVQNNIQVYNLCNKPGNM